MKNSPIVDTNTAARLLSCTQRHIRDLFYEGIIKGFYLGKDKSHIRIYRDSLDALKNYDPLA